MTEHPTLGPAYPRNPHRQTCLVACVRARRIAIDPLANRGGHPFDRAATAVARCEHIGPAGRQHHRLALCSPLIAVGLRVERGRAGRFENRQRPALRLCHVGEARQVKLMRNGDRLCRTIAVLGQNQVCLAATGVVTFERVWPMQQDDHVRILLDCSRLA